MAVAEEAIWLGRLVVALLPDEPEARGLLALMLHREARRPTGRAGGRFVPLSGKDARLWLSHFIARRRFSRPTPSAAPMVGQPGD